VSEQLTPPLPASRRHGAVPWLAVGIVAVFVAALVVALARHPSPHPAGAPRAEVAQGDRAPSSSVTAGGTGRAAAIKALLASRARAIHDHDRAALLATIDPTRHHFAVTQARLLANLRAVPLASWSYTVRASHHAGSTAVAASYPVPTYAPVVSLHYRVRGFDTTATDLAQYPTFTQRGGHWYLASLTDFGHQGDVSATDLWDYGPVDVVRRPDVLVLGPPTMLATMQQLAGDLHATIPRVTSVWGPHWARRVVAQVPQTQRELGAITGDTGDLSQLAALSSAEVSSTAGHPAPVGARISVNPSTWPALQPLGRLVVLTHELTHVASRADTGSQTPRWLQEGFADYVGFLGTGVAPTVVAKELAAQVRAGQLPDRLPPNRSFAGSSPELAASYEQGWLACRLIAARAGQSGLVRFYRQVGTSTGSPDQAVSDALHRVLHVSTQQFIALWRSFIAAQLT
jgi:hypothetical protein